jgi:hypothetical protein
MATSMPLQKADKNDQGSYEMKQSFMGILKYSGALSMEITKIKPAPPK